jgi:hypothetical protein
MKIKVKHSIAGNHNMNTFSYYTGQVVSVSKELGNKLIHAGYAEKYTTRERK